MWRVLSGLTGLGVLRTAHPFGDESAMRRLLERLPKDDPAKSLEQLTACIDSWEMDEAVVVEPVFAGLRQVEAAGRAIARQLTQMYQFSLRPARRDEERLWEIGFGYWSSLTVFCELLLPLLRRQNPPLPEAVAWLGARLIAGLGHEYQWQALRYGPVSELLWQRAARALQFVEAAGVAHVPVAGQTARREYAHLMALHATSLASLTPAAMYLADALLRYFQERFALSDEIFDDAVYSVDLAKNLPPQRRGSTADGAKSDMRYLRTSRAYTSMVELFDSLNAGHGLPAELVRQDITRPGVLGVLPKLIEQFSAHPPLRLHSRRRVHHRVAVVHGLPAAWQVFSWGGVGTSGAKRGESWVLEDASEGGFGASLQWQGDDWLRIGALLSMCPEGGDNWVLGKIRRCQRRHDGTAQIGIETLGRQVSAVDFRWLPSANGCQGPFVAPGLLILDGNAEGECRVVVPAGAYHAQEVLCCQLNHQHYELAPLALLEQGGGYAVARYAGPLINTRSTDTTS